MNTLRSFTETVVTTPTDTFPISFEYDEKYDAVHVFLNDVAVKDLGYTVSQVNAVTLKIEPAIPEGTVRIERETDIDKMKYIFDAGALFIDQNVDADFKQIVHSQQEVRDGFIKLRGDVLPLVHGLQEALQQAQEASEAAQEAAQITRSASQVIDEGGLTQQELNNGVGSIAELLSIPNPKHLQVIRVLSRNAGTFKGGGTFIFHAGSTKDDGGMFFKTPTGSWHRIILEVWHNVQWWGAVGDGVTDDTQAIKRAVEAHGAVDVWDGGSNPVDNSFCTIYFPPSEGPYIVTDTIYILPYMRIKGDSSKGGSLEWVNDKYRSCIEARFPENINYKFVISTLNRLRETGELCPWYMMPAGAQYDSGFVTGCFGSCVEDIVIQTLNKDNRVYGAIKMQNSPECSVERCFIRGFFDVGVAACGAWNSRFDFSSDTYKCGFVGYGDMNNTTIRGYHHGKKGNALLPLPQQVAPLMSHDTTSGLPFDESTKRFGVYLHYAYGFVLDALINEYHDVGLFVTQSQGSVNSLYNEGNDISVAVIASSFRIGSLMGVANNSAFALGTGANIYLDTMSPDHYKTDFLLSASEYTARIHVPKALNVPYNRSIIVDRDVIYLDATNGNDKNSGLHNNHAVKTLTQALLNLTNADNSTFSANDIKHVKKSKTLIICDSSEYSLTTWVSLTDMDLTVKTISTSLTPKLRVSNYNYLIKNCNISITGVNLLRTYDNSYQASHGFFRCEGDCSIAVNSDVVDLDYHFVSVDPTTKAKVKVSIMGNTGAMGGYAKYFHTVSKNVFVEVFIRLNNTVNNINMSADNGIDAPPEAYIIKSVSSVL
uniref:Tail fiber protein n=1 Tax=Acinetobacter phage vB_Ab_1137_KEN_06 TaxID=3143021 RepID=A0AAU8KW60_9VIRU